MSAANRRRRTDPDDSEAHVHRRASDADAVLRLHDRVDDHDRRLDGHDKLIDSFRSSIEALNQNMGRVADVLETLANLKGFWGTLKLISAGTKVLLTIAAGAAGMWGVFKFLVWLAGVES